MHRVAGGKVQVTRRVLRDRDRPALGEPRKRLHRARIAAAIGGDDQRLFRRRDPGRERLDRFRIGVRGCGNRARSGRRCGLGNRGRKRLARQDEIDRAHRARHRRLIGAGHDIADLLGHAQLVVPFHQLAQHAGLVEHFLRPVDRAVAAAEISGLGDRRAPGREEQRNAIAAHIGDIVDRVGGTDIDVHHHRLRLAGHQIGAVRHGDCEVLVRHQHRPRHLAVGTFARAAIGLDDRRKVGAGIGEEKIDAMIGKRAQKNLACDRRFFDGWRARGGGFDVHGVVPLFCFYRTDILLDATCCVEGTANAAHQWAALAISSLSRFFCTLPVELRGSARK